MVLIVVMGVNFGLLVLVGVVVDGVIGSGDEFVCMWYWVNVLLFGYFGGIFFVLVLLGCLFNGMVIIMMVG